MRARLSWLRRRSQVYFDFRDWWIGVYVDPEKKRVYVCPLPTLVFQWYWGPYESFPELGNYQSVGEIRGSDPWLVDPHATDADET